MAVQQHAFPDLEGPDFIQSEGVADVGAQVLDLHGAIGGVARINPIAEAVRDGELTILWLLNMKPFNPDTDDEDEPKIAGKCVKAPGLWRDVTGFHFAIWAREYFWTKLDVDGRRALILHELLHVEVNRDKDGNPKFATRKHDVEDFVDVARQYGPAALAGEGGRYVRAAALFAGEPEPIAAALWSEDHPTEPTPLRPLDIEAAMEAAIDDAAEGGPLTAGLRKVAETTGNEITISHGARSVTISPKARKDQALADATAHRLGRGKD